jgi:uncharacterized membrane protein (UPF0127 family)
MLEALVVFPSSLTTLRAEVVSSEEAQARGLSDRRHLADGCGMLFIYKRPEVRQFWMKNTQFPLDLIFVDAHGQIISIERGEANSEKLFGPEMPVQYVIETNAGFARQHQVRTGQRILFQEIRP